MRNFILRHPNAVRSKNVVAKRCTVVHKERYVFLLDVVRTNHFWYTISRSLVTYLQTLFIMLGERYYMFLLKFRWFVCVCVWGGVCVCVWGGVSVCVCVCVCLPVCQSVCHGLLL